MSRPHAAPSVLQCLKNSPLSISVRAYEDPSLSSETHEDQSKQQCIIPAGHLLRNKLLLPAPRTAATTMLLEVRLSDASPVSETGASRRWSCRVPDRESPPTFLCTRSKGTRRSSCNETRYRRAVGFACWLWQSGSLAPSYKLAAHPVYAAPHFLKYNKPG